MIEISSGTKQTGPGWKVFARKGFLAEWRKGRQVASIDLRKMPGLSGAHNHQNACAAYAAARSLGLAPRLIEDTLASFSGLRHRSQRVAEINGVVFINDSKATNVDAASRALQAFKNIHWIAGGQAKEGGFEGLKPSLAEVKAAYFIGEAAEALAKVSGDLAHTISGTLESALEAAAKAAEPGDVVLLAPACASFDQFKDFEARGDAFIGGVEKLNTAL